MLGVMNYVELEPPTKPTRFKNEQGPLSLNNNTGFTVNSFRPPPATAGPLHQQYPNGFLTFQRL